MSASMQIPEWASANSKRVISEGIQKVAGLSPAANQDRVERLAHESHVIHDVDSINLNPATNLLNPRAEAMMSAGMGSRPSLGLPGDKYEMGLEAIEQIELTASELACEVFKAKYSEIRVASGSIANLYAFMATTEPHDTIIAPPASIGGHVTHHGPGSAGMYRLNSIPAPINESRYSVDVDALRSLAREVKPKLITLGASLNLFAHPISDVREIADEVGARVLFDAAHLCGMVAGGTWINPLEHGAHLMTMSTYKSLGGPAGGLIVTNEEDLAQKLDAIAWPGLTANFDAGKIAALAITLADWKAVGNAYAAMMVEVAQALATHLQDRGVPIYAADHGFTESHQFAIEAARYGGGQYASHTLRKAGLLACGIGLPIESVDGDLNGIRIGTPEIVRMGLKSAHMETLADFIVRGLDEESDPITVANEVREWRRQFKGVHYTVDVPS